VIDDGGTVQHVGARVWLPTRSAFSGRATMSLALARAASCCRHRPQHLHRGGLVLVLATARTGHLGPGPWGPWIRRTADRSCDVLAAGAARSHGLDSRSFVADLDFDRVVDFGIVEDCLAKAGVAAGVGGQGGDPHQAMHAASARRYQTPRGPRTDKADALDAGLFASCRSSSSMA